MNGIRKYAKKVTSVFGDAITDAKNDMLNDCYFEGIEVGISATIASLYESGVSDEKIINLLNKYWNIPRQESIDRLTFEKKRLCKRELKEYLAFQGWTAKEIESYFKEQNVGIKINHNSKLWGLWNKAERLKQEIESL